MWHRWASSAGPPASTGAGAEGSSGGTWHHCIKIGKRWKKTEGDVMKVDGDGWRAFQKSWAFPHRSPFWSKFIYKIVDFEHFSMLFIEGSRSIYDMRFQSWPATKWLLKIQKHIKGDLDWLEWGFPEFSSVQNDFWRNTLTLPSLVLENLALQPGRMGNREEHRGISRHNYP